MDDCIRVYYSAWDAEKRGRITFVDLDKTDPTKVLYEHNSFILDVGRSAAFDHDGVGPSYIIVNGDHLLMYYFGFQRTSDPNFTLVFCGLAVSYDNGVKFERVKDTPVLERLSNELDLRSSVSILKEDNIFRVWYTAPTFGFTETPGRLFSKDKYPNYSIRYIESTNPFNFEGSGKLCLELEDDEFAVGRPWVIKDGGKYKMWYSRRGVSQLYRFGYAESEAGVVWHRRDEEVGMDVSSSGWDSEMICFPSIIDTNGNRYMFYNGNDHGRDGFGLAVWKN
jgi:hypothetical protein